jgi:hypothetical protein
LLNKKFSQTNAKLGNEILKRFKIKKVTGIIPAAVLYLALSQEVTSHSGPRDLFPLRDQSSLNAEQRRYFLTFLRSPGIGSASLYTGSLAGRHDNPIPARFPSPYGLF